MTNHKCYGRIYLLFGSEQEFGRPVEEYRSGHNGPHSKCGSPKGLVGSNPTSSANNGMWLSLVEHYVRDVGAAGSNPVIPTKTARKPVWLTSFLSLKGKTVMRHGVQIQSSRPKLLVGQYGLRVFCFCLFILYTL